MENWIEQALKIESIKIEEVETGREKDVEVKWRLRQDMPTYTMTPSSNEELAG